MADLQKIASTYSIDLQPIGSLQERDHARLVDCLTQELGGHAAALLAEPVTNRDGSRTDWYARGRSRAVSLASLDETDAANLRERLATIERQVEDLSARLATSPNANDRHLASALANCLTMPGEEFVYAISGDPVLVAWGFSYARKPGYRGGLAKVAPMKVPAAAQQAATRYAQPPIPAQDDGAVPGQSGAEAPQLRLQQLRGCLPVLLWLLFAFLIAAILFLLLRACAFGVRLSSFDTGYCRASVATAAVGDLQREIEDLESRLLVRRDDCARNGRVLSGPADATAPQSPQDIQSRLTERNAQAGSLQISLVWNGLADLDLSVRCGSGNITFNSPRACGGALDVDSNNGRNTTPQPVENIFWAQEGDIPPGDLPIAVTLFNMRGERIPDVPYTVRIQRKDGERVISERTINGTAQGSSMGRPIVIGNANQ